MFSAWVLLVLILIQLLPVVIVYIWYRLAKYKISLVQFLFAILAGAAAFFPALVLQNMLTFPLISHGRGALFYNFFIRIALTEELSRSIMLLIFFVFALKIKSDSYQSDGLNIIKQGTAIGLVAGLGFAILETARYAANDMNINIALLRLFTAALHAACGSRAGSAVVMFKTNPKQALLRFFSAVAIHGVYNLMVNIPGLPSIAALLITISALTTSILSIRGGWESVSISLDKSDETQ